MSNDDINEMFDGLSKLETDGNGVYIATEDNLFSEDEDNVTPVHRTWAVDEDQLASFIEIQLRIEEISSEIEEVSKLADKVSARLDLARNDETKRLPYATYSRGIQKMVELVGSKKLNKDGKLQTLVKERKELSNRRNDVIASDYKACWASWFQLQNGEREGFEDAEAWLKHYLEKPYVENFDPKNFDSQEHLKSETNEIECLGDEHILEPINAENSVLTDPKPVNENPKLGRWWDSRADHATKEEASFAQNMDDADKGFVKALKE